MDIGGFLWLIIDVSFVVALAAVMIYGIHEWRRRRRSRITEEVEKQAVDRAYRD
jgi:peptidoglycan/LPS O-acetylase OafA/YrhL